MARVFGSPLVLETPIHAGHRDPELLRVSHLRELTTLSTLRPIPFDANHWHTVAYCFMPMIGKDTPVQEPQMEILTDYLRRKELIQ